MVEKMKEKYKDYLHIEGIPKKSKSKGQTTRKPNAEKPRSPPTKEVTERRILRIINVLHGALWVDRMRKYPDREEFRGIWDRV